MICTDHFLVIFALLIGCSACFIDFWEVNEAELINYVFWAYSPITATALINVKSNTEPSAVFHSLCGNKVLFSEIH